MIRRGRRFAKVRKDVFVSTSNFVLNKLDSRYYKGYGRFPCRERDLTV